MFNFIFAEFLAIAAMISSIIRCGFSWKNAKKKEVKKKLKNTVIGAFAMIVLFYFVYALAPFGDNLILAGSAFILVLVFVIYASVKTK